MCPQSQSPVALFSEATAAVAAFVRAGKTEVTAGDDRPQRPAPQASRAGAPRPGLKDRCPVSCSIPLDVKGDPDSGDEGSPTPNSWGSEDKGPYEKR